MSIKLFILGDVRLYREGLALQLAAAPGMEVVGHGPFDGAAPALSAVGAEVALADIGRGDIARLAASLKAAVERLRVIAVGVVETESEVLACAAAGVDGFVRAEAGAGEAARVVESVMRGELVCSPKAAAQLYRSLAQAETPMMTGRESEVAELIERGLSNKEIALALGIEPATAKNHVQSILQKLGVHRRGQAAAKLRKMRAARLAGG